MPENANFFDRILDATSGTVDVLKAVRGSTDSELMAERERFNRLNGSGAANDRLFMRGTSADLNVDGATPTFFGQILNTSSAVAPVLLLVAGVLLLWYVLKRQ